MAKRSSPTLPERVVTALYRKDYKSLGRYLNAETVNLRTEGHGRTLLMLAASETNPDPEVVRFLIARGADANLADTAGRYTALHLAVCGLHKDIVQVLLRAGADPNAEDASGWTPLHHVVAAPDPRFFLVRELAEYGADPDQKGGAWKTAKELATETGRQELFRGVAKPRRRTKRCT
jgi:ankyrin repeat protein